MIIPQEQAYVEINGNLGSIYTQGMELVLNARVSRFLTNFAYSYIDGKDKETDTDVQKISQHKVNWNILYEHDKFNAALTTRYYSDITTAPTNSHYEKDEKIPGSLIFYVNAGYDILENLKINVSVDNIFNEEHYGAAPYGESVWIQPRAPQALRKIYVGISTKM